MAFRTIGIVLLLVLRIVAAHNQGGGTHSLHRRALSNYEFQPDDPRLFDAIKQLFEAFKLAYANSDNRFVVGGSIATNHWFPNQARPVKDLDFYVSRHPATDEEERLLFVKQALDKIIILNNNFTWLNPDEIGFRSSPQQPADQNLFIDLITYLPPNKDYFEDQGVKLTDLPSLINPKDDRLYSDAPALFTASLIYAKGLGEIEDANKRERKMENMISNLKTLPTKPGFRLDKCQLKVVDYAIRVLDEESQEQGLRDGVANFYDDVVDILFDVRHKFQGGGSNELRRRRSRSS